jgi:hypothetical protein
MSTLQSKRFAYFIENPTITIANCGRLFHGIFEVSLLTQLFKCVNNIL